jgi:MarR family transcriptional regulator, transcriptional regulator for hemolysin
MRADPQKLRQSFTHALLLSSRSWRRLADGIVKVYGLSDATALPLVLIGRLGDGLSQTELAEAVGVEGPSLVRLLDQLGAQGLVQRREDPSDRRAKILSLTDSGRALVAKIEADLERLREQIFGQISTADLEASMRVLRAIADYSPAGHEPIARKARA